MLDLLWAVVVGGLAGWIAEKIMKFDTGLLMNIVLGIAGSVVLNLILGSLGFGGFGPLIGGIIGACLLIYFYRMIKSR
jgi:uncharacterized membrane protein YeaQ/YmgE (transglycosylase-associated protein family)